MKKVLFITVLLIGLQTQAQGWWKSSRIRGNGKVITKKRTISQFDKISVGGSFTVKLINGKEESITIEAEENILPYIITEIEDGKLKIRFKKNTSISTTKGIKITVPFEEINGISIAGSGDITSEKRVTSDFIKLSVSGSGDIKADVKADTVKASISGSGDIEISGITNIMKCSVSGSGDIKAYKLQSDFLEAKVVGSGDIFATANQRIDANVVGSGDINYKGTPKKIKSKVVGSGDITDKN